MLETASADFGKTLDCALERAQRTIRANIDQFGLQYPGDTTVKSFYQLRDYDPQYPIGGNYGWTTSFWPGQLWLAYQLTGERAYRDEALRHVDSFASRIADGIDLHTHDLGFLYTLACVTPAVLCPDSPEGTLGGEVAVKAAQRLMDRYLPAAGVIQAWGDLSDEEQRGRVIIDSLLNMPLLFWASGATGDARFAKAASAHIDALRRNIVRADSTTFHTFHFDAQSGDAKYGSTQQGHADDSCWARGQAWGILGFALAYKRLGDYRLLDTAHKLAEYYVMHLPADLVPYWDMVFTDGDEEPRDSSAAAIAACGLLELADVSSMNATQYRDLATSMAVSLATNYAPDLSESNALLMHSVYSMPNSEGVDEGCLWGDYFYMELLARLRIEDWVPYWRF